MQKAIEYALKTWYDKDHLLHLELLHPVFGLAGEAGELMDLWKKNEFKPGWSWWDCKHCKQLKNKHTQVEYCYHWSERPANNKDKYTPLIIDELGDLWYYLRILYYIAEKSPELFHEHYYGTLEIYQVLAEMNSAAAEVAYDVSINRQLDTSRLHIVYSCLNDLLFKLDYDLERLTKSNWQKLKGGDNHGWKDAIFHK